MKRLGVNIDHVATIRNARGEFHPDPFEAALFAKKKGANSITIHLREDRRHINDKDAKKICSLKKVLVNLEISMNDKIVKNALKIKPNYICIVPENRKEITTEGGLNLKNNQKKLKIIISKFKKLKIKSLDFGFCVELPIVAKKNHMILENKIQTQILKNNYQTYCKMHLIGLILNQWTIINSLNSYS